MDGASAPAHHAAGSAHVFVHDSLAKMAADLLANHTLADLLLFGGFLLWAVLCFRAARARDRAAGVTYPVGTLQGNALTLAVGLAAWALLAFGLHGWLFGVRPFG
jgi:uncharacterized membrane protein